MTTGELSPWGRRSPDPHGNPYGGPYEGPWGPTPAGPAPWSPAPPWAGAPYPVTDEQLGQLPPPVATPVRDGPEPRPAVIGLAVTLAVTASLLWVCGLSLFLLVAVAGTRAMSPIGEDGFVFHTLHEAVLRMGDGLWLPLYGFPLAAIVTGFLLLARRPWTRIAHSAAAVASLGWAAWWLRDSLLTWLVVPVYVATSVGVLWVPAVGRWYARRPQRARPSLGPLTG